MNGSDYLCTHYTRCICRNQSWKRGLFFLFYEEAALWPSAAVRLSVILVQHFAQWQKLLLKTVKNATGGFSRFNVAAVTAASEAQDAKIVWK